MEGTLGGAGRDDRAGPASLAGLAPFGNGNEEPVFVLPRARVVRADRVGREGTAIRAFIEGEGGGVRAEGDAVPRQRRPAGRRPADRARAPLHLAGHLRAEEWNGAVNAGFVITDAAVA